nr:immunoglobulin heavy chain junction region [Mus musculus]MBK4183770.1 immunoglobulin heavy chain junction region [Mus musculus]MBK4183771.1 immunoglobulin heavy chain junction region [Mus musculus]
CTGRDDGYYGGYFDVW